MDEVTFKVFRFDPETDQKPRYQRYRVALRPGLSVLEALLDILDHQDGSLAFRFSCRGAVCGICAMYIAGAPRLACRTQVAELKRKEISIAPLPGLPLIKDLVVDMEPFFAKYEQIRPYFLADPVPGEKEGLQTPQQRRALAEVIDCFLCGLCYAACPVAWTDRRYLGPAALAKAYRFIADSRDGHTDERLALALGEDGLWRCHTIFNCVEVCPRGVNPTHAIQEMKRLAVWRRLAGKTRP